MTFSGGSATADFVTGTHLAEMACKACSHGMGGIEVSGVGAPVHNAAVPSHDTGRSA